jgi:hypothetical protein
MSEIKVNKISQRSGTAITLGNSGTDFQLPSGADIVAQSGSVITIAAGATITNNGTATGFGRTGAVDWDTTPKTTGFTAVNGVGYFCDTTSAAFTMTLPATPSAGAIVALKDYANTFDTNNLTIGRNGSKINGSANNAVIVVQGQALTLIYIDATQGWSAIYGATDADLPVPSYVAATGGTILTCGDYKTHVFTGPGTFTVSNAGCASGSNSVEYMVVAGGGGGSFGGGGAGGFRQNYPSPTSAGLPVSATSYPITVGAGGSGNPSFAPGSNSIFSTITSAGGGNGGGPTSNAAPGASGGSGGGGGHNAPGGGVGYPGGSGNTPPVSPPQGFSGGSGIQVTCYYGGGGGGGASAIGTNGSNTSGVFCRTGGNGGDGSYLPITVFGPTAPSYGTPGPVPGVRYFAGGGGGSYKKCSPAYGNGGAGGGGTASSCGSTTIAATAGTTNTGGGGGGANAAGQAGGSGIVVIRYKFQ